MRPGSRVLLAVVAVSLLGCLSVWRGYAASQGTPELEQAQQRIFELEQAQEGLLELERARKRVLELENNLFKGNAGAPKAIQELQRRLADAKQRLTDCQKGRGDSNQGILGHGKMTKAEAAAEFEGAPSDGDLAIVVLTAPRQGPSYVGNLLRLISEDAHADQVNLNLFLHQSQGTWSDEVASNAYGATLLYPGDAPYPQLAPGMEIKRTFGDPEDRVRWRTQHVFDYVHAIEEVMARSTAPYILVLEDDLLPGRHLAKLVLEAARSSAPWQAISFWRGGTNYKTAEWFNINMVPPEAGYCCGAVAFAYRRNKLPGFLDLLKRKAFDAPVDYHIEQYWHYSLGAQYERVPSLLQHLGHKSTFARNGKERESMKSPTFSRDEAVRPSYETTANGYIGCYMHNHDDSGYVGLRTNETRTVVSCAIFCERYRFYVMSWPMCYCTNEFDDTRVEESACDIRCLGKDSKCQQRCGGTGFASIHSTGLAFDENSNRIDLDLTTKHRRQYRDNLNDNGRCRIKKS